MKEIVVLGTGGHASVVREACESAGFTVVGFLVEEGAAASCPQPRDMPKVLRLRRDVPLDPNTVGCSAIALAIGNNQARLWWCDKLKQAGYLLPPIVHAGAWVSQSATLGDGVFIGAGAAIQAETRVSRAALINTNATVEHHCTIGAGSHIAPGAVLAGLVTIGGEAMIGAGAVIRDRATVGDRAVVGAGAVVVRDVPDGLTVVGVPAKPLH